VTAPEDAEEMAHAIERLIDDRQLYAELATAARKRAEQRWSGEQILTQFERALNNLVTGSTVPEVATEQSGDEEMSSSAGTNRPGTHAEAS
jgi:hypothetical protein